MIYPTIPGNSRTNESFGFAQAPSQTYYKNVRYGTHFQLEPVYQQQLSEFPLIFNLRSVFRFVEDYLKIDWINPSELYGISKYGQDSYRIFCLGQWREG